MRTMEILPAGIRSLGGPAAWWGRSVERRWVLRQTGRGVLAFAVLGVAACAAGTGDGTGRPTATGASPDTGGGDGGLEWLRVDLDFVAAYVLVRGERAAVVDTGVAGSADAIESVLDGTGLGWPDVGHVVLTHKHADHVGSAGDVLDRAASAQGYAGAADIPGVATPRPLRALDDGADVFGLQVVATPGHTAGHLSVFDEATGVLLAGDALTNQGGLGGSNPQYTEDEADAAASVRRLADLRPSTILVGHGPPVTADAAATLSRLADSLV